VAGYPLVHLFITGHAGGDKYLFDTGHLLCQFKGVPAFAAPASTDYKYTFFHLQFPPN
jgi:hypothetical protein